MKNHISCVLLWLLLGCNNELVDQPSVSNELTEASSESTTLWMSSECHDGSNVARFGRALARGDHRLLFLSSLDLGAQEMMYEYGPHGELRTTVARINTAAASALMRPWAGDDILLPLAETRTFIDGDDGRVYVERPCNGSGPIGTLADRARHFSRRPVAVLVESTELHGHLVREVAPVVSGGLGGRGAEIVDLVRVRGDAMSGAVRRSPPPPMEAFPARPPFGSED